MKIDTKFGTTICGVIAGLFTLQAQLLPELINPRISAFIIAGSMLVGGKLTNNGDIELFVDKNKQLLESKLKEQERLFQQVLSQKTALQKQVSELTKNL